MINFDEITETRGYSRGIVEYGSVTIIYRGNEFTFDIEEENINSNHVVKVYISHYTTVDEYKSNRFVVWRNWIDATLSGEEVKETHAGSSPATTTNSLGNCSTTSLA